MLKQKSDFSSHLDVEQSGSVSLPLLHQRHVFDHCLFLVHPLQLLPLVHHAGSHGRRLLPHPGLQAVLFFKLLPTQRAAPETPPQCPLQETRAFPLRRAWAVGHRAGPRSECLGRVLHPGPQSRHGEHLGHFRDGGLGVVITQKVLKSQSSQKLKSLLRGRVLTTNHSFMGLWGNTEKIIVKTIRSKHFFFFNFHKKSFQVQSESATKVS